MLFHITENIRVHRQMRGVELWEVKRPCPLLAAPCEDLDFRAFRGQADLLLRELLIGDGRRNAIRLRRKPQPE